MMISKYFSHNQLKGLIKVGDVILPGTNISPSFSKTGCARHIDRMAEFLSEDDLGGLQLLFGVFRWTPKWIIGLILTACNHNKRFPGFLGAGLRMIEIGVKGAVLSPYYSNLTSPEYTGKKVYDIIGWNPKIVVHDDEPSPAPKKINLENPNSDDIKAVYDVARTVQPDIREWGVKKRLMFITNLKAVILENQERILDRVQEDTGKSRFDAITAEIFGVFYR